MTTFGLFLNRRGANRTWTSLCTLIEQWSDHALRLFIGTWDFAFLGSSVDPVTLNPTGIPTNSVMLVPAAWDTQPPYYTARGTVLYRTTFASTPGAVAKLFFAACSFYCAVYVDGVRVADHGIGYSPFWVGGLSIRGPRTLLEVVSDNQFNVTRAYLHSNNDGCE